MQHALVGMMCRSYVHQGSASSNSSLRSNLLAALTLAAACFKLFQNVRCLKGCILGVTRAAGARRDFVFAVLAVMCL